MTRADVVIVGAGPAGSVTALLLARAGVRVVLLDRSTFPRPKACGDCLSAGASVVLHRLGLLARVHALPHARLDGWEIVAPDGRSFRATFAAGSTDPAVQHALSIERSAFDAALLDAAIESGAVFLPRVRVRELLHDPRHGIAGVDTHAGRFPARVVVGADGLRSVVAARLGAVRRRARLRKVSLTAHLTAPGLATSLGEMHIGDGIVAGLAAVDPSGGCNLTVVADAARHGRAIAADPASFARAAVMSLPRLHERIPAAQLATAQLLASGPFDRPVRRVIVDGAALVGDAAGYYDPFTGQGIYQALRSAEILAPVLVRALAAGDITSRSLRAYARRRRAALAGARELQHIIDLVLSRPRLASAAIARIARARTFAAAIIAVTGDLQSPARLLSPRTLLSLLAPGDPTENPT